MGEYPRIHLQHTLDHRVRWDAVTITYALYPINVRRPAKGVTVAAVRCGSCGAELDVRVYSRRNTMWARLRCVVGAITMVGSLAVVIATDDHGAIGEPLGGTEELIGLGAGVAFSAFVWGSSPPSTRTACVCPGA